MDAGEKAEGIVHLAEPVTEDLLREELGEGIERIRQVEWDKREGRIIATLEEKLGALLLSARSFAPKEEEVVPLLCEAVRSGSARIIFSEEARQFQGRVSLMKRTFPGEELAGPVGNTSPLGPRSMALDLAEGDPYPGATGSPGLPAAPSRPSVTRAAAAAERARTHIPPRAERPAESPSITPPEISRSWP